MDMTDTEIVSSHTQGPQANTSENEGTSNKAGIRKWKRVARTIHQVPDQVSNPFNGLQLISQKMTESSQVDDKIKTQLGYSGGVQVNSKGKSGGLALLWKDDWDVTVLSMSLGHIDARVRMEDGYLWRFSGFYGNPNPSFRRVSWDLLRRLQAVDTLPWVCGGDFNELLNLDEKLGGGGGGGGGFK
ncbi:hypothetical protein EZV62_018598 [Acer yangbiense]|uniref:Endonuclease/exonuclease/phosphatase domain-containing protein n=1 Tax=Acer yangbiense TaxID=1000413 RepID=A0A5C7HKK7_9ROSI|nr:hypothetical protein EZV62_018598 [Acer yangbiense]